MAKRRFRIDAGRYGGETVVGEVSRGFVDFFIDRDESDLIETVQSFEWGEEENELGAPIPKEGFNAWYECDNFEHVNNAYADGTWTVSEVPGDGSDDYAWDEDEQTFEAYHLNGREP